MRVVVLLGVAFLEYLPVSLGFYVVNSARHGLHLSPASPRARERAAARAAMPSNTGTSAPGSADALSMRAWRPSRTLCAAASRSLEAPTRAAFAATSSGEIGR